MMTAERFLAEMALRDAEIDRLQRQAAEAARALHQAAQAAQAVDAPSRRRRARGSHRSRTTKSATGENLSSEPKPKRSRGDVAEVMAFDEHGRPVTKEDEDEKKDGLSASPSKENVVSRGGDTPPYLGYVSSMVEDLMDRDLEWHGVTRKVRDHVNFDAQALFNAFTFRGAMFGFSMEQTDKTLFEVLLVGLASAARRPCVLLAGLSKPSAAELTDKMVGVLSREFGVSTTFVDNSDAAYRRVVGEGDVDEVNPDRVQFLAGQRLLVLPGYAQHRMDLLEAVDARNALVIMDESDVVMQRARWEPDSKEARLARVIGRPQDPGARVTGVVLVSATHIGDMWIWRRNMGHVPQQSVFVDPGVLAARGFTTQDHMKLLSDKVSLNDAKPAAQHGILSEGFKELMRDFKTCPGRRKLMMVASCPRVSEGSSTLYTQAAHILSDPAMDPDAVVLVHHGGKNVGMWREKGRVVRRTIRKRTNGPAGKLVDVATAGQALELLEGFHCCPRRRRLPDGREVENDRRFVAVGYNAFARTASVRTSDMVITHLFVLMGKGRHSADLRQTLMRPAGKTTDVRRANNGGVDTGVKVVTPAEDWDLVTGLYNFQVWLAERRMEDPAFDISSASCPVDYDPVVTASRGHAPTSLNFRPDWHVAATDEERQQAAEARAAKRERLQLQQQQQPPLVFDETDIVVQDQSGESDKTNDADADADARGDRPVQQNGSTSSGGFHAFVREALTVLHSARNGRLQYGELKQRLSRRSAASLETENRCQLTRMKRAGFVQYDASQKSWSITPHGSRHMRRILLSNDHTVQS